MKMRYTLHTLRRSVVFVSVMAVMVFLLVINSTLLFSKKGTVPRDIQGSVPRQPISRWRRLLVHVVEEHHEVLPYWFRAADHGRISKGVTLAAAMAGLITNYVWIWPKWDEVNHNESSLSGTLQLGWTITKQTALGSNKAFCMCMMDDSNQKYCTFMSADETSLEVKMEEDGCFIKASINYTEIREDLAKEYLESIHKSTDNMILDIDEDFFGCEYASQSLHDLLVPDLSMLDKFLYQLFCPLHQNGEAALDGFLTDLIEFIKHTKCKAEHNHRLCENKTLNNTKDFFMKRSSIWNHYMCKASEKRRILLIDGVIEELFQLNSRHLNALQRVGFCLSTSRKSYQPINPSLYVTCKGANSPNETVVTEHRTNPMEITERGRLLKTILRVFKASPPKLITVCRSIRDGYTPRKYFTKIEHTVLNAIRTNYQNAYIHHDNGLLGGKKGFKQYHKN